MPLKAHEQAIGKLDAVEGLLTKAEALLTEIESLGDRRKLWVSAQPGFDAKVRECRSVFESLPAVNGRKTDVNVLKAIGANGSGTPSAGSEAAPSIPSQFLKDYRVRIDSKRMEAIRPPLIDLISDVDSRLEKLRCHVVDKANRHKKVEDPELEVLRRVVIEMDALLGSHVTRPPRWTDMQRHLSFGEYCDLDEIITWDWPEAKQGLRETFGIMQALQGVELADLDDLLTERPSIRRAARVHWDRLSAEEFERLVYSLFLGEPAYENPEWMTKTTATDRGLDISVNWVHTDPLLGTVRKRIIIQCKHWRERSIGVHDIATLREQMKLWQPPRVDYVILATSGRFSTDLVDYVEQHNQSESPLHFVLWPDSRLEVLLSTRPHLIDEYSLR